MKQLIEAIQAKAIDYNNSENAANMARALDKLSSDIFSEAIRFIYELIQNADDASTGGDVQVEIAFSGNYIVVAHNGKPFDEADVKAICSVSDSTKKNDAQKVGYKGIGFKSVFGKGNDGWVCIQSKGEFFRFDKSKKWKYDIMPWQIIPIYTPANDLPAELHKYKCPAFHSYNVATAIRHRHIEKLKDAVKELLQNSDILLFLRHVSQIEVKELGIKISRKIVANNLEFKKIEITATREGKTNAARYLLKNYEAQVDRKTQNDLNEDNDAPDKLKETEEELKLPESQRPVRKAVISFAVALDENDRIVPLKDTLIYTFLPTKIKEFNFPFIINSNFLTNASREQCHDDSLWNEWLFQQVGFHIFKLAADLAKIDIYKRSLLNFIPSKSYSSLNLHKKFNQGYEEGLASIAFLPTTESKLIKAKEAVYDASEISSFIGAAVLLKYLKEKHKRMLSSHLVLPDIEIGRAPDAISLSGLGVTIFSPSDLKDFFASKTFIDNHKISENYQLIEFLYNKAQHNKTDWSTEQLSQMPFIFNTKNVLCPPKILFFAAFSDSDFQEVDVIHDSILKKINKNKNIYKWLSDLGISQATDESYIAKLCEFADKRITIENATKLTQLLFSNQNLITDDGWEYLQKKLRVKTIKDFITAKEAYLSEVYFPKLSADSFMPKEILLSPEYIRPNDNPRDWAAFFSKVGVKEDITLITYYKIEVSEKPFNKFKRYFEDAANFSKDGHNYPHLVTPNYPIYGSWIPLLDSCNDYNLSKRFWHRLLSKYTIIKINKDEYKEYYSNKTISEIKYIFSDEEKLFISNFDNIEWGYFGSSISTPSIIFWLLKNFNCIPTTQQTCLPAPQVFLNTPENVEIAGKYLPVFDCEIQLSDDWKSFFGFKPELTPSDYCKILEGIADAVARKNAVVSEEKERIGKVYERLLATFKRGMSSADKQDIKKWASNGLLLSQDNRFLKPSQLYLIPATIDSSAIENIAILWLPAELNKEEMHRFFHEVFGVNRIGESEFELVLAGEQTETSLTQKMRDILPYLALFQTGKENVSQKDYQEKLQKLTKRNQTITYRYASEILIKLRGKQIDKRRAYFKESTSFVYYSGSYNNPITLYELPDEICKALHISQLQADEIRTLLSISLTDAWEWMKERGYTVEWLPKPKEEEQVIITTLPPSPTVRLAQVELYTYEWLNEIVAVEEKAKTGDTTKIIRFKYIQWVGDDTLQISQPNIDVLPDDLSEYFVNNQADIVFYKRSNSHSVRCFLLKNNDFELYIKPLQDNLKEIIGEDAALWKASLELPKEDFLIRKLKESFQNTGIANKTGKIREDIQRHFKPENITFLFGPPGTGKTSRLAVDIIAALQKANYQNQPIKILFIAPTNRAADVLAEKIIQFAKAKNRIENYLAHLPQEQHKFIASFTYKGLSATLHQVVHRIGVTESALIKEHNLSRTGTQSYEVAPACVAITTVHRATFDRFNERPIAQQSWDWVILDEASMIPLPYGIFALFAFRNNRKLPKFTISGDPFQIPPVGATPSLGDLIENDNIKGWSNTNLYTLFELNSFNQRTTLGGFHVEKLMTQYRSVPSIGQLFSRYKYEGLLQSAKNQDVSIKLSDDLELTAITTIDCEISLEKSEFSLHRIYRYGNYGTYHVYSGLMAIELAIKIVSAYPQKNVGIIAPYNSQVKLVQTILDDYYKHAENLPIKAATVHRFQGDERSVIIFINMPSLNKNDELALGQISHFNNSHIINVAISRAVEHLVIIKPFDNKVAANGTIYKWNEMSYLLQKVSGALPVKHFIWNQIDKYLGTNAGGLSDKADTDEYRGFVSVDVANFKKSLLAYQVYAANDRLLILNNLQNKISLLKRISRMIIQYPQLSEIIRKLKLHLSEEAKRLILQKEPVNLFPSEDGQIKKGDFLLARLSKVDTERSKVVGIAKGSNNLMIIIHFQANNNVDSLKEQQWILCKTLWVSKDKNGQTHATVTDIEILK